MNVFELTIIYLALGAPVGIYHITTHPAETAVPAVANGTLNVVLWPLYVALFVFAHVRHAKTVLSSPDAIRIDLEIRVLEYLEKAEIRKFRDILARYIGLSEVVEMPIGTSSIDGLAAAGLIKDPVAASAVARRSNRERLLRQRSRARKDLLSLVCGIPEIAEIVQRLAASLHDDVDIDLQPAISSDHQRTSQNSGPVSLAA